MESWSALCLLIQNSTNADFNINASMEDAQKDFLAQRLSAKWSHCKREDNAQCSTKHVKTIMDRKHHRNRMFYSKRKLTGPERKASASNMEPRLGFKEYVIWDEMSYIISSVCSLLCWKLSMLRKYVLFC